jgi:hypothetical protein
MPGHENEERIQAHPLPLGDGQIQAHAPEPTDPRIQVGVPAAEPSSVAASHRPWWLCWPLGFMTIGICIGLDIDRPGFAYLVAAFGLTIGSMVAWLDFSLKHQGIRRFYLPVSLLIPLLCYLLPWITVSQLTGGMAEITPLFTMRSLQAQSGFQIATGKFSFEVNCHAYTGGYTSESIARDWPSLQLTPLAKVGGSWLSRLCLGVIVAGVVVSLCLHPGRIRVFIIGTLVILAIVVRNREVSDGFPLEQACYFQNPQAKDDWLPRNWGARGDALGMIGDNHPRPRFGYTRWFFYAQLALAAPVIMLLLEPLCIRRPVPQKVPMGPAST